MLVCFCQKDYCYQSNPCNVTVSIIQIIFNWIVWERKNVSFSWNNKLLHCASQKRAKIFENFVLIMQDLLCLHVASFIYLYISCYKLDYRKHFFIECILKIKQMPLFVHVILDGYRDKWGKVFKNGPNHQDILSVLWIPLTGSRYSTWKVYSNHL